MALDQMRKDRDYSTAKPGGRHHSPRPHRTPAHQNYPAAFAQGRTRHRALPTTTIENIRSECHANLKHQMFNAMRVNLPFGACE